MRHELQNLRLISAALITLFFFSATALSAQRSAPSSREHLTPQEIELVRDEQRIDRRTELFIKAIDRRLLLLSSASAPGSVNQKAALKDAEKYGAIPDSTTAQLLSDVARILDEAITNIDDASDRKRQQELLPKALRKLSDASTRYLTQLTPMRNTADEQSRIALEQAIESAESIVDAAAKLGG